MASPNHVQTTIPREIVYQNERNLSVLPQVEAFEYYSQRVQWLRAAVLGANDGLVSVASLMMGVGAVRDEVKAMMLTFFAGLFASACSMAMEEFVSMLDIEISQLKRKKRTTGFNGLNGEDVEEEKLRISFRAATVSALVFSLVAFVPLLAAGFITDCNVGLVVAVVAATTMVLVAFGGVVAVLGRAWVALSCARMVVGGWMAMAFTFGVTKLLSASGLEM